MEEIKKIAATILFILVAIIVLPTVLFDGLVSRHVYSQMGVLSDFSYSYQIANQSIVLEVENITEDYWENVGARFVLYDAIGLPVTDRQGKIVSIEIEIGQLRPGERVVVESRALPDGTVSARLEASRQKKVRT